MGKTAFQKKKENIIETLYNYVATSRNKLGSGARCQKGNEPVARRATGTDRRKATIGARSLRDLVPRTASPTAYSAFLQ